MKKKTNFRPKLKNILKGPKTRVAKKPGMLEKPDKT